MADIKRHANVRVVTPHSRLRNNPHTPQRQSGPEGQTARSSFFYYLESPYAYLTADRIDEQFESSITIDWVPVLLGGIYKSNGRRSWAETDERADGIAEVARRAAAYGMPAFNHPQPWPNNGLTAIRIAAWAHSAGAGRRFARAGLDPDFAIGSAEDPAVKQALIDNTQAAIDVGAIGVPTVVVGDQAFWGDYRLHEAVAAAQK